MAFTAEQKAALSAELGKVKAALDGNTTADYAALKAELKAVYDKCPLVAGGKKWWAITIDDLKDGATVMFECGPTDFRNKFMKAYPDNNNGNSVMCNDEGKSSSEIWQLVATGGNDAIYTDKPTYYLKDVTSGKYLGVSDALTSTDPGHKRMVENTEMAYPFCFLTASEIKAKENHDMNVYGNNDAIFIHHSNADGTWFRLSRFGAYKHVYYINNANNSWQAWNIYTGEGNYNKFSEVQQAINDYGSLCVPAGDAPGYYSKEEATAYNNALAAAKAVTKANTRAEMQTAIDNLKTAYDVAKSLTPIQITEGYYRLISAYDKIVNDGKKVCAYDCGDGYLGYHILNASNDENIFKFTKAEKGWYIQNFATGKYVGMPTDGNEVNVIDEGTVTQAFHLRENSIQWTWTCPDYKYPNFTYTAHVNYQGYVGRYWPQGVGGFDSWVFEKVDVNYVDMNENSAMTAQAAENVSIKLTRTFASGYYNTLCLPFALDKQQIQDAFGEDTKVYKYDDCDENGTLNFSSAESIEANVPYLITTSTPNTVFKFYNVNITDAKPEVSDAKYTLTGNYSLEKVPAGSWFLDADKFYLSTGKSSIKTFRAYFTPVVEGGSRPATISIDGMPTSISKIALPENENKDTYTIDGVKLPANAPLTKGVYIKGGKKVIVK